MTIQEITANGFLYFTSLGSSESALKTKANPATIYKEDSSHALSVM